jgi:hypothetical protein
MKTSKSTSMHVAAMLMAICIALSACAPAPTQAEAIVYKEFTLPFPEEISFELPEDWEFWGNAGYLSPDDGKVYAGVRLAWIEEGRDSESLLYNEGSIVHDKKTVRVGDLQTHRYIVEVTLTSASTGEVISHTYEMIYAFPAPDGETVAGIIFSAPTKEELEPLVPVAEHMVESLKWGNAD